MSLFPWIILQSQYRSKLSLLNFTLPIRDLCYSKKFEFCLQTRLNLPLSDNSALKALKLNFNCTHDYKKNFVCIISICFRRLCEVLSSVLRQNGRMRTTIHCSIKNARLSTLNLTTTFIRRKDWFCRK